MKQRLPLFIFLLASFSVSFFSGCNEEEVLDPRDKPLGPAEPGEGREYHNNPTGYVVVTNPDGTQTIVIVDDAKKHLPGPSHEVEPVVVGKTEPVKGPFLDLEILDVPMDRLPEEVFRPLAHPELEGGEFTEEILRERKRQSDRERGLSRRYVTVTEEEDGGFTYTVIRIYDGNGVLISTTRKKGKFKPPALLNESTGEKVFMTDFEASTHWVIMDFATGGKIGESTQGMPGLVDVVDIEAVNGNIVIITKIQGGLWVRIRIFGANGQLLHTIDIPGEYVKSITNGTNVKAIVGKKDGITYQDFINVATGQHLSGASATGIATNGMKGEHADLEYKKVNGQDRFIETVYDKDRDETSVRIMDGSGNLISLQIIPGKYRIARVFGDDRKIFICHRQGRMQAEVIELTTGQKVSIKEFPGEFQRISDKGNAKVGITNKDGQEFELPY